MRAIVIWNHVQQCKDVILVHSNHQGLCILAMAWRLDDPHHQSERLSLGVAVVFQESPHPFLAIEGLAAGGGALELLPLKCKGQPLKIAVVDDVGAVALQWL